MSNPCFACREEIPLNHCQYFFQIDGRTESFHLSCMEPWAVTEIPVYKVTLEGSTYFSKEKPEEDIETTVEQVLITNQRYHCAKEFKGF